MKNSSLAPSESSGGFTAKAEGEVQNDAGSESFWILLLVGELKLGEIRLELMTVEIFWPFELAF